VETDELQEESQNAAGDAEELKNDFKPFSVILVIRKVCRAQTFWKKTCKKVR
jgi:hypothetical protein